MESSSLSDTFFTIFLMCGIFSALLLTNGAMLSRIGLFNALNRSNSADSSKFNEFALFNGTRKSENKNKNKNKNEVKKTEKDNILEFSLIMTIGFFILFVIFEFIIG